MMSHQHMYRSIDVLVGLALATFATQLIFWGFGAPVVDYVADFITSLRLIALILTHIRVDYVLLTPDCFESSTFTQDTVIAGGYFRKLKGFLKGHLYSVRLGVYDPITQAPSFKKSITHSNVFE